MWRQGIKRDEDKDASDNNQDQVFIGDYVRIRDIENNVYEGELMGVAPADCSESGVDELIVQRNSHDIELFAENLIIELIVLKGYAKTKCIIEMTLTEKYIHWNNNVFARQDSLLPVVKVEFDDEDSETKEVKVFYCSDLNCSRVLRSDTFQDPSAELVLESIDRCMFEENWFSYSDYHDDDSEWNLITPVGSFQCTQLGIRTSFNVQSLSIDVSILPETTVSEDTKALLIRVPIATKNVKNRARILFYKQGVLEGDKDSVQLKHFYIDRNSKALVGIKDGYAFAIKSENSKDNGSVSFKYGLLNRGIKAIVKDSDVEEICFKVAWVGLTSGMTDYKQTLKKLLNVYY